MRALRWLLYWVRWLWAWRPDWLKTRAYLQRERDDAVRRATIAVAAMENDSELLRLTIENGSAEAHVRFPMLHILTAECRVLLKDAPNYVEARMRDDLGELVLRVQKLEGKTPHELRRDAEVERDALKAQMLQLGGVR